MRLTKIGLLHKGTQREMLRDADGNPILDSRGRPQYIDMPNKIPFKMEIEPYSIEKAGRDYGIVVVDVQYRIFTKPDDRIGVNAEIEYKGKMFVVTVPPKDYDNHWEILITYKGAS